MSPGDEVRIYATIYSGRAVTKAITQSPAQVGTGGDRTDPPEGTEIESVDWPFETVNQGEATAEELWSQNVERVREHALALTVAPDLENGTTSTASAPSAGRPRMSCWRSTASAPSPPRPFSTSWTPMTPTTPTLCPTSR